MRLMVLKMMALFSGLAVSKLAVGKQEMGDARGNEGNEPLRGENEVQWEANWYHIDDGAQGKLLVRRGHGQGGQWAQFRNQYNRRLRCQATITSILEGGEKVRSTIHPICDAHQTRTVAPQPGAEISKVEVSELHFCEDETV